MNDPAERPPARRIRIPRAAQLLLVLVGVQVVGVLWPVALPPPPSPDDVLAAQSMLVGEWRDARDGTVVEISDESVTLTRDGVRQSVAWELLSVDGDAVVVRLEHPTPVERRICRVGERLDLDCPSGIWFDAAPRGAS